jgi:hypothetical protein
MKKSVLYRSHLILGESFQRRNNGSWVGQYTLMRPENAGSDSDFPSHQHQFNAIFRTKREADEYALRRAKEWVDRIESAL